MTKKLHSYTSFRRYVKLANEDYGAQCLAREDLSQKRSKLRNDVNTISLSKLMGRGHCLRYFVLLLSIILFFLWSLGAKVLIDDNPRYAIECAEVGIKVLLFDYENSYPWSKMVNRHPLVTKVHNWEEVEHQLGLWITP
ncbi:unnamed protein product [Fraxinus pennsylvanica]|uniref:Uncharacterized protein n=1 Tax=Fraxinus pennsylvanica TaxID=56036 RepID=A0AAD1ZNV1_9LAMI|nr:unnamed protein product [Fraxinus pennsylvanica]